MEGTCIQWRVGSVSMLLRCLEQMRMRASYDVLNILRGIEYGQFECGSIIQSTGCYC